MKLVDFRTFIFFKTEPLPACYIRDDFISDSELRAVGLHHFNSDPIFFEKNRVARFSSRLSPAHSCYGYFDKDGRIISYFWLSYSKVRNFTVPLASEISFVLKPGTAYIWDCFTRAESRRQGFYRKGLASLCYYCFQRGLKKVYICSHKGNTSSIGGILSAGFKRAFVASVLKLGIIFFIKSPGQMLKMRVKNGIADILGEKEFFKQKN